MFSNDIEKDTVITKLVPLTFSPEAAREAGSRGIDWERTVDIGDGGEIPETYHAVAADGSVIQLIDSTGRYSMGVDGFDPDETFGVFGTFGIWGQVGPKSRLLIAEDGLKSLYIESLGESCSGDGAFIAIREPASKADGSLVATAIIDSSVRSMETANEAYEEAYDDLRYGSEAAYRGAIGTEGEAEARKAYLDSYRRYAIAAAKLESARASLLETVVSQGGELIEVG